MAAIGYVNGLDQDETGNFTVVEDWKFNNMALQSVEAMEELVRFPDSSRAGWPAWIQLQFTRYIMLLEAIEEYRKSRTPPMSRWPRVWFEDSSGRPEWRTTRPGVSQ